MDELAGVEVLNAAQKAAEQTPGLGLFKGQLVHHLPAIHILHHQHNLITTPVINNLITIPNPMTIGSIRKHVVC